MSKLAMVAVEVFPEAPMGLSDPLRVGASMRLTTMLSAAANGNGGPTGWYRAVRLLRPEVAVRALRRSHRGHRLDLLGEETYAVARLAATVSDEVREIVADNIYRSIISTKRRQAVLQRSGLNA